MRNSAHILVLLIAARETIGRPDITDLVSIEQAGQISCSGNESLCDETIDEKALLQTKRHRLAASDHGNTLLQTQFKASKNELGLDGGMLIYGKAHGEACTSLLNKNTHFAVKINVGTPPQTFELVADTGSNAVIVTSCVCVDNHYCDENDHCFRGQNKSSTFEVKQTEQGPLGIGMTFGSGTVQSVIASDIVSVAGISTVMKDGLLLMVDRRALRIAGQFEGILGLGPILSDDIRPTQQGLPGSHVKDGRQLGQQLPYETKLFLKEAGVNRFSICFNDAAKPGVLRLNVPEFRLSLPAIGTQHWGLGLYGVSVGSASAPATLCGPETMKEGMQTPCGAIPDSGTTLMMGPAEQVNALFSSLCQSWGRCKNRPPQMKDMTDAHAFQMLLYRCSEWLTEEKGINEVPSIFLSMGSPDNLQSVELTAWSYITETQQEQYARTIKYLNGVIPVVVDQPTGEFSKICYPSIGIEDYVTQVNGPVWLVGTPLFYQYTVGYDLQGPSISFGTGGCADCTDDGAALLHSDKQVQERDQQRARPMRVSADLPRVRKINKSLPL